MKKKLLLGSSLLMVLLFLPITEINSSALTSDPVSDAPTEALPQEPQEQEPQKPVDFVEPPADTEGIYNLTLTTSIGLLTYYNQHDIRWANSLFGGSDTISGYGCGPTALAMVVSSFTEHLVTPDQMAQWAAENHYWVAGSGSVHALIPEGASAFGLKAASFQDFTVEGVRASLSGGHVLIALMGPGHFTASGHFIVITELCSDTTVRVADPSNLEVTQVPWDIQTILDERNKNSSGGGPIWEISP